MGASNLSVKSTPAHPKYFFMRLSLEICGGQFSLKMVPHAHRTSISNFEPDDFLHYHPEMAWVHLPTWLFKK